MIEKPIVWVGSARRDVRAFPKDARRLAGVQLRLIQQGFNPFDWKPMPAIGVGVREIRIHTGLEHRVYCVAKFGEAVYALHAFEKRTKNTSQHDVALAKQRYQALIAMR